MKKNRPIDNETRLLHIFTYLFHVLHVGLSLPIDGDTVKVLIELRWGLRIYQIVLWNMWFAQEGFDI